MEKSLVIDCCNSTNNSYCFIPEIIKRRIKHGKLDCLSFLLKEKKGNDFDNITIIENGTFCKDNILEDDIIKYKIQFKNITDKFKLQFNTTCLLEDNTPITKVLSFLYLGNKVDSINDIIYNTFGIKAVINVTPHLPCYISNCMRIPVIDNFPLDNEPDISTYFLEAIDFINNNSTSSILIHCSMGISRSPTIVLAYMIYQFRLSLTEAYNFLKKKRSIISPNLYFMSQLYKFEQTISQSLVRTRSRSI